MSDSNQFVGTPALIFSTAVLLIVLTWIGDIVLDDWVSVHEANAAYQQNAENDRRKSAIEIANTCYDRPIDDFRTCVGDNLEAHYRDQATNEDLQAQQDMAFWAFWLLIASTFGILISGVGVLLIIRSLSLGIEANAQATKAAVAANTANEIMRKEKRPWVVLDREIECDFHAHESTGQIAWNYELENKGLGLAHDIKVDWEIVKRHHFQNMKAQLHGFLQKSTRSGRLRQTAVIFPQERTKNHKYILGGFSQYIADEFSGDPDFFREGTHFMFMVCVTYRLSEDSNDFGFDVRMFQIEESKRFIGPWGHTILEYGGARLVG